LEIALNGERLNDRRTAKRISGNIRERFDASGDVRRSTLRAGRFWPPGSSPISTVFPDTLFDRLLPDRPKSSPAQLKPHRGKVA
jgi:hypothetical protein